MYVCVLFCGAGAGAVLFLKGRSRSRSRRKSDGSATLVYVDVKVDLMGLAEAVGYVEINSNLTLPKTRGIQLIIRSETLEISFL